MLTMQLLRPSHELNFGWPRSMCRPDATLRVRVSETSVPIRSHDQRGLWQASTSPRPRSWPKASSQLARSFAVNRDVPAYKRPATPNAPLVLKPPPSPAPLSLACSARTVPMCANVSHLSIIIITRTLLLASPSAASPRTGAPRKVRPTRSVAGESTHTCTRMIYA